MDRHAATGDKTLEATIFSRIIDHKRDVKRGKISEEDAAPINQKIAQYTQRLRAV
jgi:hypothetical protein